MDTERLRAIAEKAYVYGYPMVDGYRVQYGYFQDAATPEFKARVTLYLQHEDPGGDRQADWLPAPEGPFMAALRLYWPQREALDGTWREPPLQRV